MLEGDFIVSQIPERGSKCGFIVGTFKAEKIFVQASIGYTQKSTGTLAYARNKFIF